jgi:hypothetical protein
MNEAGGQETKQALSASSRGAEMTSKERAGYWAKLIFVSIPAIIMLGMNIYFAVRFSHINRPDSQLFVRQILMILVVSSVLFLSIPLVLFYKIVRRRTRTGSFFPAGEELLAIRKRRNQPFPMWFSITGSVFYLLLAIDETHNAMTNHLHPVYHWGFAAMIWALTAFFIVQIFQFRPSKRKDVLFISPKEPQTPPESESR